MRHLCTGKLKNIPAGADPKSMDFADMFLHFMPKDIVRSICAHTQASIRVAKSRSYPGSPRKPHTNMFVFDESKFYRFLVVLMNMQIYPQPNREDYWADGLLKEHFENIMDFETFDIIARNLTLIHKTNLRARRKKDPFVEIRSWLQTLNAHLKWAYEAGGLLVADESMSKQTNKGVPGWKIIIRKPNNRGHEFHTAADATSKILMHFELVEGKGRDCLKRFGGDDSKYQAHVQDTLRMLDWAKDKDRTVILDAGFGSWNVVTALHDFGIHCIANVKKNHRKFCKDWLLSKMKRRNDTRFATATFVSNVTGEKHTILGSAHCDRQPMVLISTIGTGAVGVPVQRTRYFMDDNLEMKKYSYCLQQPDTHALYRKYFNVIDLINRGREAGTALHDVWDTKDWIKRLFSTTIGFVEGNAIHAHLQLHPILTSRTDNASPSVRKDRIPNTWHSRRKKLADQLLAKVNSWASPEPASPEPDTTPYITHRLEGIPKGSQGQRRRIMCSFCKRPCTTQCVKCDIACCKPLVRGKAKTCYAMHLQELLKLDTPKRRKVVVHISQPSATIAKRLATIARNKAAKEVEKSSNTTINLDEENDDMLTNNQTN